MKKLTKPQALTLQRLGMILIVTVMLTDRFLFPLKEGFLLTSAVISAAALILSITSLKLIQVKEEAGKQEKYHKCTPK